MLLLKNERERESLVPWTSKTLVSLLQLVFSTTFLNFLCQKYV